MGSVDFRTFHKYAPYIIRARKGAMMIRSRHGVGKSEAVKAFRNVMLYDPAEDRILFRGIDDAYISENEARLLDYGFQEARASQMTEGDLLGMPDPNGVEIREDEFVQAKGHTIRRNMVASKFRPYEWFLRACVSPQILFLDEVDRGVKEVRQGLFQLCDSRRIGDYILHPGTVVFAAINGGENSQDYQVEELDPAEQDRYVVFDLDPTHADWIDWAKQGNVPKLIWEFLLENSEHLEHNPAKKNSAGYEPGKVYPSRRSWHWFGVCLEGTEFLDNPKENWRGIQLLAQAYVGDEASVKLGHYAKAYAKILTPDDIIKKGKWADTANWDINDHLALIEKMSGAEIFNKKLTDKQMQNLVNYADNTPGELLMKLIIAVSGSENEISIQVMESNLSRFNGGTPVGKDYTLQQRLERILTGDNAEAIIAGLSSEN